MAKLTDSQIEKFLQDLFGRHYMNVYEEDLEDYYKKVRKFVKKHSVPALKAK